MKSATYIEAVGYLGANTLVRNGSSMALEHRIETMT